MTWLLPADSMPDMAKPRTRTPTGPTLSSSQAVALLTASLDGARKMASARIPQAPFDAWAANTLYNLKGAFGEEATQASEFDSIVRGTHPMTFVVFGGPGDTTDYDRLRGEAVSRAIPLLESSISNLEILLGTSHPAQAIKANTSREVFIVHGHDDALKLETARFVDRLGLKAVILSEQANKGRTVIEKFESHAGGAGFAIVLLTPDDHGGSVSDAPATRPRARQNVILELGYFIGKLGRTHVCALYKGDLELPSDIHGVVYIKHVGSWALDLAKELKAVWPEVDMNKAF